MTRYTQIHMLTSYPPSNLNRDDLGRPKTAVFGGCQRLRISSQSLKRAWRTSESFREALDGHVGIRTRSYGQTIMQKLREGGISDEDATAWTREVVAVLGKNTSDKSDRPVDTEQLAHISQDEKKKIDTLVAKLVQRKKGPTKEELDLLSHETSAVDIALFGRMLASAPKYNIQAAAQVAHALTVHEAVVEDDFFTAVDDLNKDREETGSGHMGDIEFGSGIFYSYICVDRELLVKNLNDDTGLADRAIQALIRTAAMISPSGKQNSFASRSFADYMMVEHGDHQPRTLATAFLAPVRGRTLLESAITQMEQAAERIDRCYGTKPLVRIEMNVPKGKGSLEEICSTVVG